MAALNRPIYANRPDSFFREHFMPSLAVGDPVPWVERARALGRAAQDRLGDGRLDLRYGPGPLQTFDVFPAADPNAPIAIYFHGGYWRAYDKADYRYIPGMLVPQGVTTIMANYDLCPAVTLDQIVDEAIACVAHVRRHGRDLGGDPERVFLLGSSAGGDLVAMCAAHDFRTEGLPSDTVRGTLSITGVHRLEPVLRIPQNADIRLTPEMATRNTTFDRVPVTSAPVVVAVGGDEPSEWIRMSVDYDTMLRENGIPGDLMILPGEHHYSITQTLADPDTPLARRLLSLIRET